MDDLKDLLSEKAEEMRLSPEAPPSVLRRARRRRAATGALAGALTVSLALGTIVGVRAALRQGPHLPADQSPTPSSVVSPTPSSRVSPAPLGPFPERFVAVKEGSGDPIGSVVVVDSFSGRRRHAGVRVLALVADLDVRVLTEDGELLRALRLDPTRDYQPQPGS